jgi:hypothetical protein
VLGPQGSWSEPGPRLPTAAGVALRATSENGRSSLVGRNLVLASMVLLVTIRFFTEVVAVLPRAANFIDIPIFVTLVAAAILGYAVPPRKRRWSVDLSLLALAFIAIASLSVAANSGRIAVAPVLVFIYGFVSPLAVFVSAYSLWPPGHILSMSRMIVALGIVQLAVVGVVDVPLFMRTHNPDDISGTFGTNAYQLVFFLLVLISLVAGIATVEPTRSISRFAPILVIGALLTIFLAQYRTLLIGTAIAILVTGALVSRRKRGLLVAGFVAISFGFSLYYTATHLPVLKLNSAVSALSSDPSTYVSGRLRVAKNVFRMYGDMPSAVLLGTGPGTYSSRAWQTFATTTTASTSRANVAKNYVSIVAGGTTYSTDVSEKYVLPQAREGAIIQGSKAVSTPYSSYTTLLAEVGVIGFAVMCFVYIAALVYCWRSARTELTTPTVGDPLPALALATTVGFLTLVQLGFFENWLEVTRVTFMVWMMLAVVMKERDARHA